MAMAHPELWKMIRISADQYDRLRKVAAQENRSAIRQLNVMLEAGLQGWDRVQGAESGIAPNEDTA